MLNNSLNLFSNFTYFLDDPEHGDQFEQAERRTAVGGRLTYRRLGHLFERHIESAVGVQVRRDWLDPVGLYHTEGRQRLSTTREDEVDQTMAGVFAQTEIELGRRFRLCGQPEIRRGLRPVVGNRAICERGHGLPS